MLIRPILKIAIRKWKKQPFLSLVTLSGLCLSVATLLSIGKFAQYEWQYDRFHKYADQVYRIANEQFRESMSLSKSALTYSGMGPLAKVELPEVIEQARLVRWIANDAVFQSGAQTVRTSHFYFSEPSIFDVFSIPLKTGDPKTALQAPNTIILSERIAQLLFKGTNPIGQEVQMESRKTYLVTGVFEELPRQSHIPIDIIASLSSWNGTGMDKEGVYGDNHFEYGYSYTYLKLHPDANTSVLESHLEDLVTARKSQGTIKDRFYLQPLTFIHLYSDLQFEPVAAGNGRNLWILLCIAAIILVLAWVNFINIATATYFDESKSIGVRRILGAGRRQVFVQLAIENSLFLGAGLILGWGLATAVQPWLSQQFDFGGSKQFLVHWWGPLPFTVLFFICGSLITSLIPASLMTRKDPLSLFLSPIRFYFPGLQLRKVLLTVQFMIIILFSGITLVVFQQSRFINRQPIGMNLDHLLILRGPLGTKVYQNMEPAFQAFKGRLQAIAGVQSVTMSNGIPGIAPELVNNVQLLGKPFEYAMTRVVTEPDFFEQYSISFLRKGRLEGNNKVILNEAAAGLLGYRESAQILNKQLLLWGDTLFIAGVVHDFHYLSVHHPIVPAIYQLDEQKGIEDGFFSIKTEGQVSKTTLQQIESAFSASFPGTVFDHFDQAWKYQQQYTADHHFRKLSSLLTVLAFLIAGLGLFAVSMLVIRKELKSISIRKVLGASTQGLLLLLSRQFLILVGVAWFFTMPLSWHIHRLWLQQYNYRIDWHWSFLFWPGLTVLLVAAITVGWNSYRVAVSNPSAHLKSE